MDSPREILNGVNPMVEFRRLKQAGSLAPDVATHLASEAVEAILKQHTVSGTYPVMRSRCSASWRPWTIQRWHGAVSMAFSPR